MLGAFGSCWPNLASPHTCPKGTKKAVRAERTSEQSARPATSCEIDAFRPVPSANAGINGGWLVNPALAPDSTDAIATGPGLPNTPATAAATDRQVWRVRR